VISRYAPSWGHPLDLPCAEFHDVLKSITKMLAAKTQHPLEDD